MKKFNMKEVLDLNNKFDRRDYIIKKIKERYDYIIEDYLESYFDHLNDNDYQELYDEVEKELKEIFEID